MEALVEEFNASQSEIEVELHIGGSDGPSREAFIVSMAGGVPPDVFGTSIQGSLLR